MPVEFASFTFVASLAAVINGLGIVRWLNSLAEFLRRRDSLTVDYYWVYGCSAAFQFILHILLWWSLWSIRAGGTLNFLSYLYMLMGPILMFIGSAFLTPVIDGDRLNLRQLYYAARPVNSTVLALVWLWAMFSAPVFRGIFAEPAPIFGMFFIIAMVQRVSANNTIHKLAAVANWLLMITFIAVYALELGGMAPSLDLSF